MFKHPLISNLRNKYYFPLMHDTDIDLLQEEQVQMSTTSNPPDVLQTPVVVTPASVNQVSNLLRNSRKLTQYQMMLMKLWLILILPINNML
jgi:hypothetical protein